VLAEAKEFTRQQFAQYGMAGVGDDMLNDYAKSVLGNKEENRRLHDKVLDSKVISLLSQKVAVKETPISIEDFGKLFENN
jgi:trigger factor